jgi:hypothetical protein
MPMFPLNLVILQAELPSMPFAVSGGEEKRAVSREKSKTKE